MSALTRAFSAAPSLARRHALFLLLLAAGAALRGVTFFAYRPALIFYDSTWYLAKALDLEPGSHRPSGYAAFLRLLPFEWGLAVVPFVQHLFGLLMAALIYVLLLRLGVRTWLAALATAPVLLDSYQLNIEQFVLSDTLFLMLVLAGAVALLWRRPLGLAPAGLAGLLFAAATLTRSVGLIVIVPAVLTVLFLRAGVSRVLVFLVLFSLPLAAYAGWFHSVHGAYALNGNSGRFLYGRVAPFADCTRFSVPPRQRVLCPRRPVGERLTENRFVWSKRLSPYYRLDVARSRGDKPKWLVRSQVAGDFAKRVIRHQPFDYARAVAGDFVRGFAPTRTSDRGDAPVSNWRFRLTYPRFRARTNEEIGARVDRRLASFLRTYQRFGYTPGPVLAAGLVVGLLGAVGTGRARRSGLRSAAFLFSAVGFVLTLGPVAAVLFSWRYQLPQLVLLPPAFALGLTALLWKRTSDPTASETPAPASHAERASDAPTDGGALVKRLQP